MSDLISYVSQKRHEEFLFLGKLYTDKEMNFRKWYEDFFQIGGFEKITPYQKNTDKCNATLHVIIIKPELWTVYIGMIADEIDDPPEGFILKKFPSGEFLVVTSEWKPTRNEAHEALDQTEKIRKIPDGYVDDQFTYTVIEKFYECPERGHRWERWYPIKKQ